MNTETKQLLDKVLKLSDVERVQIINPILSSLDQPDESINEIWEDEADARIRAYEAGEIETVSEEEVFAKYKKT